MDESHMSNAIVFSDASIVARKTLERFIPKMSTQMSPHLTIFNRVVVTYYTHKAIGHRESTHERTGFGVVEDGFKVRVGKHQRTIFTKYGIWRKTMAIEMVTDRIKWDLKLNKFKKVWQYLCHSIFIGEVMRKLFVNIYTRIYITYVEHNYCEIC